MRPAVAAVGEVAPGLARAGGEGGCVVGADSPRDRALRCGVRGGGGKRESTVGRIARRPAPNAGWGAGSPCRYGVRGRGPVPIPGAVPPGRLHPQDALQGGAADVPGCRHLCRAACVFSERLGRRSAEPGGWPGAPSVGPGPERLDVGQDSSRPPSSTAPTAPRAGPTTSRPVSLVPACGPVLPRVCPDFEVSAWTGFRSLGSPRCSGSARGPRGWHERRCRAVQPARLPAPGSATV